VTTLGPTFAAAAVGLGALRENPLRTLLSTAGAIIGVTALVAVLSLEDALHAFARISSPRSGRERRADVDTARRSEPRQPNDHRA
jgi:putative ABC transport system permease protein